MMIDWVTAKVPFYFPTPISGGQFISVNQDGSMEYAVEKRLQLTGSYSGVMAVRTTNVNANGETVEIEISGNPVKFLQGHNVWGSADLPNLVAETVTKVSTALGCIQPVCFYQRLNGAVLSRVDLNEMYDLGTRSDCLAYLNHVERNSRSRSGTAIKSGTTVYLNRTSRRWTVKFYNKGQEIALPRNFKDGSRILPQSVIDYADAMLRIELTLKSNELRDKHLRLLGEWHNADTEQIFNDYYERITVPDQQLLLMPEDLPTVVRSTYALWHEGHDVRQFISTRTFYRHRKQLLDFGIDISIPSGKQRADESNVSPLLRTIVLKPAVIPDWAYGTDLLFEPRKLCNPLKLA